MLYRVTFWSQVVVAVSFVALLFTSISFSPSQTIQPHGGRGGPAIRLSTSDITPIPNFSPPCTSVIVTPTNAIQIIWPGMVGYIAPQYQNAQAILCFDKWTWTQTDCTMHFPDILKALGWPSDLFTAPQSGYQQCVGPLSDSQLSQLRGVNKSSIDLSNPDVQQVVWHANCTWQLLEKPNVSVDLCGLLRNIVHILVTPLKDGLKAILTQVDTFVWSTPALDKDTVVTKWWAVSLGVITLLLVVFLAWAGLRYMLGQFSWLTYAQLMELIPRLIFGVLLAYLSLQLSKTILDGANALDALFPKDTVISLATIDPPRTSLLIVQAVYIVAIFAFILEQAMRYALLFVVIGFAPLWCFAAALRETQDIAKAGIRGLIILALVQPLQKAVLVLGLDVLNNLTQSGDVTLLNFLVALAIAAIALSIFFTLGRYVFGGVGLPAAATALGASAAGAGLALREVFRRGERVTARGMGGSLRFTRKYAAPIAGKGTMALAGLGYKASMHGARYTGNAAFSIADFLANSYRMMRNPKHQQLQGTSGISRVQQRWDGMMRRFANPQAALNKSGGNTQKPTKQPLRTTPPLKQAGNQNTRPPLRQGTPPGRMRSSTPPPRQTAPKKRRTP